MEKFIDCSQRGTRASKVVLAAKNPFANAGHTRVCSGSGRFPRGGHGDPHQCFCLKNPMDRGAWWATVLEITKSTHRDVQAHGWGQFGAE